MGIADQIIQVESGGNPNARNPNSSAGGLGQFIDSTWLNVIRKHRPDLADKFSPSELLAMKSDGQLSKDMTDALAGDNGAFLRSRGIDPSPGNVYLAHFAGPAGAASILGSTPDTPVASVLAPDAMKANPFLKNMTVADLQKWASTKMGGAAQPAAPAAGGQAAVPANPMAPPSAAGPMTAPMPEDAAAAQQPNPLAAIPAMIQQFQQQEAPAPAPMHIDTPAPVGLARAKLLARAMAQSPLTGGQG